MRPEFLRALVDANGFDWDRGNSGKNWKLHRVSDPECEEVFFQEPLLVVVDEAHSQKELRYFALGRTAADRRLFVVFTLRGGRIRVISARPMSRRERRIYESYEKKGAE